MAADFNPRRPAFSAARIRRTQHATAKRIPMHKLVKRCKLICLQGGAR